MSKRKQSRKKRFIPKAPSYYAQLRSISNKSVLDPDSAQHVLHAALGESLCLLDYVLARVLEKDDDGAYQILFDSYAGMELLEHLATFAPGYVEPGAMPINEVR